MMLGSVCARTGPASGQTGHTSTTLLFIFRMDFLCLNLGPSMVKKNGNPTRRATQTQLCSSFSMLPSQRPSWTGPKKKSAPSVPLKMGTVVVFASLASTGSCSDSRFFLPWTDYIKRHSLGWKSARSSWSPSFCLREGALKAVRLGSPSQPLLDCAGCILGDLARGASERSMRRSSFLGSWGRRSRRNLLDAFS